MPMIQLHSYSKDYEQFPPKGMYWNFFFQHLSFNSLTPIIRITSGIIMKPPSAKFPVIKICVLLFIVILYAESFNLFSSSSIFNLKPCPTNDIKPKSSKSSYTMNICCFFGVVIVGVQTKSHITQTRGWTWVYIHMGSLHW